MRPMNKKIEFVFVTGTGHSGSGFVLDWLREQYNVSVLPVRPFSYRSKGGFKYEVQ